MKPVVIHFHAAYEAMPDAIDSISDITDELSQLIDAEFLVAGSPTELMRMVYGLTTNQVLIVYKIGHLVLNNINVEDPINLIESLNEFVKDKITISIAPVIFSPMPRLFLNNLRKRNIAGFIPAIKSFGQAESKQAYDEILFGSGEYWPICVEKDRSTNTKHNRTPIKLTRRQQQILELVSHRGLSNKRIAQHLKISESTVKVHMSAILKAYGLRNRTQLAIASGPGLSA
jgi:DNA-binding NarL/FixJ family response regulator